MLSCFSMFEIVVCRRASDEATERHRWQPNNNAGPRISRARRAPGVMFFLPFVKNCKHWAVEKGAKIAEQKTAPRESKMPAIATGWRATCVFT